MIRLLLTERASNQLSAHLAGSAPLEEGAFCIVHEGRGRLGRRLTVDDVLLPGPGAWEVQHEGLLRPSAQWVSAAVSEAIRRKAGLLFVHSHPNPGHPCGFSEMDLDAIHALGRTLAPMLDGVFAAVVVHPEGWAACDWRADGMVPIDRIWSVGRTVRWLSPFSSMTHTQLDDRQRDALGRIHDYMRALDVAVVGCGGLGSPAAEQLVRIGTRSVILNDLDRVDTPSNVRRMFGATIADTNAVIPRAKVDVVGDHLEQLGFDACVRRIHGDVRTEEVFRQLLDADIVICATDTHGSRAVLNDLPTAYLLPVIDVGVRVGARRNGALSGLVAEVRVLTSATPCLWCRKTINADAIRIENLPATERERLRLEGYAIGSTGEPAPSVISLTVLGSGLATCALIGLFAEDADVAPAGYWVDGLLGDARETGPRTPVLECWCRSRMALGDSAAPPFIG